MENILTYRENMIAMDFWTVKVIMAWLPAEKGLWIIELDRNLAADHFFHGDFSQPNKLQLVFTILQLRISWFPLFFSTIAFMPFLTWFLANQEYFGSTYLSYSGKN